MRRKSVLIIAVGLVIASLVAIYVILSSYDFNHLKPEILEAAKDATGRELTLGGDILASTSVLRRRLWWKT